MQQCSMLLGHYQNSSWLTFSFAAFSTYHCIPYIVPGVLRSCNITLTYNQSTERLQFINSTWDAMPVSHLHIALFAVLVENFDGCGTILLFVCIELSDTINECYEHCPTPHYFYISPMTHTHTHKFIGCNIAPSTIRVAPLGRKCSSK